jgi:uncharacterized membrane protein YdjX (TVP38/TMEM64 family)
MSGSRLLAALQRRLRKKISALLPIIVGAIVIVGGMSLLMPLIAPALPAPHQHILTQLQRGDWSASRASLTQLFASYGAASTSIFLAVQVVQVIVAPVPGQILGLLGGYLFGFWRGLSLTMVGLTLGSWIAISLARLFGEHIARRLVPRAVFAKFDYLIDQGGLWNFFLLFLLPALPDDAICLIAGLTRLDIKKLLLVCVIGRLPGMAVLSFVGANVGGDMLIANATLALALVAAGLLWLFSEEAEAYFSRLSKGRDRPLI